MYLTPKENGLFCLQDRDARPGADGRSWEDHDAEWRDVRHLHVHRYGHPLLIRTDPPPRPSPALRQMDITHNCNHSSASARRRHRHPPDLQPSFTFLNKSSVFPNSFLCSLMLQQIKGCFRFSLSSSST